MNTAISTEWVTICRDQDLLPGTGLCAQHQGEQVAVFKLEQSANQPAALFALSNRDPIGNANVMSRGILGSLGDQLVVASPLYKQHFDLVSGECLEQPEHRLKTYIVRCHNNDIQLKKVM